MDKITIFHELQTNTLQMIMLGRNPYFVHLQLRIKCPLWQMKKCDK